METRDHENSTLVFLPEESTIPPKDQLRERIKIEFYKTYDVMTGVRIAATLGGFFSMMILLVLYKNYCKPSKTLSEEQLNAAVTAAAEEEDRALQAALEATSFYSSLEKRRQSLENANQVLLSPRFSSVGGGYSHLTPPLKASPWQQRGKSLPGSVLQFNSSGMPVHKAGKINGTTQEEEFDRHSSNFIASKNYLNIFPSRRVSSVTCSSADSAYLERRCSAFEMGLPAVPPHHFRHSREKLFDKKSDQWDFYYPIDIQVIQPTPEMSPTASEKNLDKDSTIFGLKVPGVTDQIHTLSVSSFDIGLAPIASISSLGGYSQSTSNTSKSLNSSISNLPIDNQGTSADDSVGSDSVFLDLDELTTDSEFEYDGFDDDYSFCESLQKTSKKPDVRTLQFASFDSYDTSIAPDVKLEGEEGKSEPTVESEQKVPSPMPARQHSSDLKRYTSLHERNRGCRKLVKTYSEPRNSKVPKTLPPWTERGRSGYIPKRQMSSPSKKKIFSDEKRNISKGSSENLEINSTENSMVVSIKEGNSDKDSTKISTLPPSNSRVCSDSVILTPPIINKMDAVSTSLLTQGLNKDLPFKSQQKTQKQLSLPSAKERRSRLQKQKNFIEDVKVTNQTKGKTEPLRLTGIEEFISSFSMPTAGGLLKPPNLVLTGSCKKLTALHVDPDDVPGIKVNLSSSFDR